MAQNLFRFTLSHDSGSQVISEPEGWAKIKLTLERDKEYHSLIELIETPFMFYGSNGVHDGGRDFLKNINEVYGVNAKVSITIDISTNEGFSYENLFVGLIDMQSLRDVDARKIQVVITRDDLWTKFKTRVDTPVIINQAANLDGGTAPTGNVVTQNLPSQAIRKNYTGYLKHNYNYGRFDPMLDIGDKFVIEYDVQDLQEIEEMYNYQLVPAAFIDATDIIPFPKLLAEEDGDYLIDFKTTLATVSLGTDGLGQDTVSLRDTQGGPDGSGAFDGVGYPIAKVFIKIGNNEPLEILPTRRTIVYQTVTGNISGSRTISGSVGTSTTIYPASVSDYEYNATLPLKKNDTITIYGERYALPATGPDDNGFAIFGVQGDGYQDGLAGNLQGPIYFWDPTSGLFPTETPTGDVTIQNQIWKITRDGALQGQPVTKDSIIQALVNTPGQTVANWYFGLETNYENKFDGLGETYLNISADTVFDQTEAQAFFLHDVAWKIVERILGNSTSFYSEYTGSTNTLGSYADAGCGWPFTLVRGLQIRQYDLNDKAFSTSFKQWWEGINPIENLGLTYDNVDGIDVIRVEEKAFFYDDSPILNLDWVNNLVESWDKDYIFRKLKFGFRKWQSEEASGIDDPQTNHDYTTVFETAGIELVQQSDFMAASLAIEQTRRTTKKKSQDYKFDNETFIISIDPALPSGEVNPLTDEYFDSVTNLLNSETRYNIELTPARNLLRWFNFIAGALQKDLTSTVKFNGGEGNYDMESNWNSFVYGNCFNITDANLSEKQNLDLATYYPLTGHLFQPIIFEFKHPLSYDQYKLIRNNRTRAIGVSTTDEDHHICFIKKLEYDLINSLGTFTVWKK